MLAVFALHGAMLALYYALGVERRPASWRTAFMLVWTALAVAVVLVYLARVRAARVRARRARAAAGR
jgi:nitric oxide reductase large subunit